MVQVAVIFSTGKNNHQPFVNSIYDILYSSFNKTFSKKDENDDVNSRLHVYGSHIPPTVCRNWKWIYSFQIVDSSIHEQQRVSFF